MTAEVEPDSTPQLVLAIPEEPLEVKTALRAIVGEDPIAGREAALAKMTEVLWDEWQDSLAPLGVDEQKFASIVAGATNEVWLWVMGDRPYGQLVASVTGRTIRRTA
jgi:hypothetical protein